MDSSLRESSHRTLVEMTERSPSMSALAAGFGGPERVLAGIEDAWVDVGGRSVHLDVHRAEKARAVVVFQPGSGAHGRCYFLLGAMLARAGCHFLGIDRFGHGFSPGERGDCTVEEALAISDAVIAHARATYGLPVVALGSSMGGLLVGMALIEGQRPDLAIAHNFLIPGKLLSLRLRGLFIQRFRKRPYRLTELVHRLADTSRDPGAKWYLSSEADPAMAWSLSARSIASLFRYRGRRPPADTPPLLVLNGAEDSAIPALASRFFLWWSGLENAEARTLPGMSHSLFHEHLAETVPLLVSYIDKPPPRAAGRALAPGHLAG